MLRLAVIPLNQFVCVRAVMPDADLDLAVRASVFGAVGTCGQRCTSLRRLVCCLLDRCCLRGAHRCVCVCVCRQIIHESVYETVKARMLAAYASVPRGDPLVEGTLLGPLHTKGAIKEYTDGLEEIAKQGGRVLFGGKVVESGGGNWVEPTIIEIDPSAPIVKTELFVPILYIMKFKVRRAVQHFS